MTKYHREINAKWKRATQKRKEKENKAVRVVAARLLGAINIAPDLHISGAVWVDEDGNYVKEPGSGHVAIQR